MKTLKSWWRSSSLDGELRCSRKSGHGRHDNDGGGESGSCHRRSMRVHVEDYVAGEEEDRHRHHRINSRHRSSHRDIRSSLSSDHFLSRIPLLGDMLGINNNNGGSVNLKEALL